MTFGISRYCSSHPRFAYEDKPDGNPLPQVKPWKAEWVEAARFERLLDKKSMPQKVRELAEEVEKASAEGGSVSIPRPKVTPGLGGEMQLHPLEVTSTFQKVK